MFEAPGIVFYQMNGLMLGTWSIDELKADSRQATLAPPGAIALAHNVATQDDVQLLLDRLARHGGKILRDADAPPHGGFRSYVADPDGHIWEIAFNPTWPISKEGYVSWGT